MPDLANAEWNRINQGHGWVARTRHAIQQVVPAVHEVRGQWNLLAAHELYIGTVLKVPDLVFMPRELEKDKPKIWVKRLDKYTVAYMKLLSGKRQKVEISRVVGPRVTGIPNTWSPSILRMGMYWGPLERLVEHPVAGSPRQCAIRPCAQLCVPAAPRDKRAVRVPIRLHPK